jgi:amidohydrolase
MPKDRILLKAGEIRDHLIEIRRRIHRHPETGFNENNTARLVTEELKALGLEVRTGIAKTGITGLLRGGGPGKTVLLRADMDCLEVEEKTGLDYASEVPGLMHACGHDAHTAWVLGAAMILSSLKDELNGNVIFLFQPAEETIGGAADMIAEGVLDNPRGDAVIGAHIDPSPWNRSGMVALKYGTMCAAPDNFRIVLSGPGGHCGSPHTTPDPLGAAVGVYTALKSLVHQETDPLNPVIIHIGMIHSGSSLNAVPDTAELKGTVRTIDEKDRERIERRIGEITFGLGAVWNVTCQLQYERGCPPMVNNAALTDLVRSTAEDLLGLSNVTILDKPEMTGEDFSYFQQKVPGTYINMGTYNPDIDAVYPLHSPYFKLDESVLPTTSALLAASACSYLNSYENT